MKIFFVLNRYINLLNAIYVFLFYLIDGVGEFNWKKNKLPYFCGGNLDLCGTTGCNAKLYVWDALKLLGKMFVEWRYLTGKLCCGLVIVLEWNFSGVGCSRVMRVWRMVNDGTGGICDALGNLLWYNKNLLY